MVSLIDIFAARRRLAPYLHATPLVQSAWLSSAADATVYLKLESLQLTSSFKIRGALNAALKMPDPGGSATRPLLVTASAGNHGRALALAGERLGMRVVVFTPAKAPETKKSAIRRHGAELHDDSPDYDAAESAARNFAMIENAVYVSPYNHPDVIAGAGTISLEILESLPAFDTVVVPVGGGGLLAGVGLAIKAAAPHTRVVGVEVQASTPFAASFERGTIAEVEVRPSLADGLIGNLEAGSITFDIVRNVVDELISVSEEDLARAVRGLAAEEHLLVEGAGAAATAALLGNRTVKPGQRAVVLVTGGNIDLETFRSVLAQGDQGDRGD